MRNNVKEAERREIMELIEKIDIPKNYRKKTTIAANTYYDALEVYDTQVIGYLDGKQTMIWHFRDFIGIDFVKANMNSQFAQVVFMTGINSKTRVVGPDLMARQNTTAMKDTNRILFCSGMFSFDNTNQFTEKVADTIRAAFEVYTNNAEERDNMAPTAAFSEADEIAKFKKLMDDGVITEDEFQAKKNQLLGL